MIKLRNLVLIALVCLTANTQNLFSQSAELIQARKNVEILTSRDFAGRGYQENGHVKAASWIESQFKEIGLFPIPDPEKPEHPYFQPFKFSASLPDSIVLTSAKTQWKIGYDYIVNSNSGSGKLVNPKVCKIGYGLPDDFRNVDGKIVVIEEGLPKEILENPELKEKYKAVSSDLAKINFAVRARAAGVIFLRKKLTASISRAPVEIPVIDMLKDKWPRKVKELTLQVHSNFEGIWSQNVVGYVKGSEFPDSMILVSAHYDHLGLQGEAIFPGANDNASGTSVLLSLAKYFANPANQPKHSIAFIAFGGEEAGLIGSRHYVEKNPIWPLENTRFILNLDLMGNGDEGITAVAGTEFPTEFDQLVALNEKLQATPLVKIRSNAPNSDHYFFVEKGVHGFFIYTMGGPPHYHDVNDIAENLKFSRFDEIRGLLIQFLGGIDGK